MTIGYNPTRPKAGALAAEAAPGGWDAELEPIDGAGPGCEPLAPPYNHRTVY